MNAQSKIYIAGHRGMVGSAIKRKLESDGYKNLIVATHQECDLTRQSETENFIEKHKPDIVIIAAAKVGGIIGNSTYKADFIYQNLMIASNIIYASYKTGVKKLLNLGSTCIYPKLAKQPLKEESLLTGPLEPTNDAYAIAKIAAIKLCHHFNEQYNTNFMSVMPTNLFGINDSYHFQNSHFLPAFIRKFHLAKCLENNAFDKIRAEFKYYGSPETLDESLSDETIEAALKSLGITKSNLTLWGSGTPYREFLFADDLADACTYLLEKSDAKDLGEFINIGSGVDQQITDYAKLVRKVIGFKGNISWDTNKPDGTPKKLSDITRIKKLGWSPKTSIEDGLTLTYKDYLQKII